MCGVRRQQHAGGAVSEALSPDCEGSSAGWEGGGGPNEPSRQPAEHLRSLGKGHRTPRLRRAVATERGARHSVPPSGGSVSPAHCVCSDRGGGQGKVWGGGLWTAALGELRLGQLQSCVGGCVPAHRTAIAEGPTLRSCCADCDILYPPLPFLAFAAVPICCYTV